MTSSSELRKLGLVPPGQPFFRQPLLPGGAFAREGASIAEAVRAQLRSDALHRLLVEYLVALGVMTMISVGAGWLLAGRALRPLRDITATARRVSGENLGERIGLVGPADELKELADTFDGMLERLDAAFASQRHFVANASHELRTPLAIMRTEVDVALADPDPEVRELRAMGEAVRETIDRCERLIESLLMLARSEAATRPRGVGGPRRRWRATASPICTARAQYAGVDDPRRPRAGVDPRRAGAAGADDREPGRQRDPAQRAAAASCRSGLAARANACLVVVSNGGPLIDPDDAHALTEPFRRLIATARGSGSDCRSCARWSRRTAATTRITAPETGGLEVRVELPVTRRLASVGVLQTSPALT